MRKAVIDVGSNSVILVVAEQTDGGPFYGMNVYAENTTDFTRRVVFETRVFEKKYYLWNIVQSELDKDKNLVGNPGW